jgi:hypothetical protein
MDDDKLSLRLLLENKFNDIRYTKQQQWHLLYLTLVAIAGITNIAFIITIPPCHGFAILLLIGDVLVGIMGCGFIIYYAYWLQIYRDEKSDFIQKLLNHSDKKSIGDTVFFTINFCVVILFFLIISVWAILIKCF